MEHLIEYSSDGQVMKDVDLKEAAKRWQHPWLLTHRVGLHDKLKKLATGAEGEGPAAELHTASKVVEVDPEKGTITLENGQMDTFDVIVGADGVYVRLP
jgi:2-polyprenyl-6-methoxyphenol hydroxylase-like FAD-dependent oxidoreductase